MPTKDEKTQAQLDDMACASMEMNRYEMEGAIVAIRAAIKHALVVGRDRGGAEQLKARLTLLLGTLPPKGGAS